MGGYQEPALAEPGGGWRWVNNEGPFSGSNGNPDFTSWAAGEPNNSGGIENHLTVGRYPDNLYGWNDEGAALGSIGGFIVEYDVPRTAAVHAVPRNVRNCQTIDGQTLVFPTGSYTTATRSSLRPLNSPIRASSPWQVHESILALTLFTDSAFPARFAAADSAVPVRFAQVRRRQGELGGPRNPERYRVRREPDDREGTA